MIGCLGPLLQASGGAPPRRARELIIYFFWGGNPFIRDPVSICVSGFDCYIM